MKKQDEYNSRFGDIPSEEDERVNYLLKSLNFKKDDFRFIDKMYRLLKSISYNTYKFTLYLTPEACPRPRYSKKFHSFYVKGAKENQQLFREIVNVVGGLPTITTATKIKIVSYLPTPSAMNRFEKYFAELGLVHALSIPDWDNLAKTYCDMIQNNLLINDSLIWSGKSMKYYSIKPRIEMEVSYAEAYDCTFNRKRIQSSRQYNDLIQDRFETELETVLELIKRR